MEALNGQARIECLKGPWLTPLPFSSMRNSRLVGWFQWVDATLSSDPPCIENKS
jgi:hypothetical protein